MADGRTIYCSICALRGKNTLLLARQTSIHQLHHYHFLNNQTVTKPHIFPIKIKTKMQIQTLIRWLSALHYYEIQCSHYLKLVHKKISVFYQIKCFFNVRLTDRNCEQYRKYKRITISNYYDITYVYNRIAIGEMWRAMRKLPVMFPMSEIIILNYRGR